MVYPPLLMKLIELVFGTNVTSAVPVTFAMHDFINSFDVFLVRLDELVCAHTSTAYSPDGSVICPLVRVAPDETSVIVNACLFPYTVPLLAMHDVSTSWLLMNTNK